MQPSTTPLKLLVVASDIQNRAAWHYTLREAGRRMDVQLLWEEGAEPRHTLKLEREEFAILLYCDEAEGKRWYSAMADLRAANPKAKLPPVCWMARSAQGASWFENDLSPSQAAAELATQPDGPTYLARRSWRSHISFSLSYDVPFYFTTSGKPVFERLNADWLLCRADILAMVWYLLARLDELAATERDEHGRVPASAMRHVQAGDAARPVLDEACLAFLHEVMLFSRESGTLPVEASGPARKGAREFRVCLTHDLDSWRKFGGPRSLAAAFKRAGQAQAGRIAAQEVRAALGRDPHVEATRALLKEVEQGLHPTLYIVAKRRADERHKWDSAYWIDGEKLAAFLADFCNKAQQGLAQLGLHPSYNAAHTRRMHLAEWELFKQQIGAPPQTHRFHYLRWLDKFALPLLKQARAEYQTAKKGTGWAIESNTPPLVDSSLGWGDTPGFRNGTAHPFELLDPQTGEPTGWTEVPLHLMDTTLSKHLQLSVDQALETTEQLLEAAERVGGVFTMLQHPHLASDVPQRDWALWWPEAINLAKAANAHFLTVSQAAESSPPPTLIL